MLILEMNHVKKYFGERLILDVDDFKIYSGERIGLIGNNGTGKTTLLRLITGEEEADTGKIKFLGSWSYIRQLEAPDAEEHLSGGEKTAAKIDAAFADTVHLLMADEPTSNLSLKNIERLTQRLEAFKGAVLLISHDRELLNRFCDKIVELDDRKLTEYTGNYDFYKAEKAKQELHSWEAYENYDRERERLARRADQLKRQADGMKKAPSRMGNSEARLHRGSIKEKSGKVGKNAKVMEERLNRLAEVKKPVIPPRTKIDIQEGSKLYSKIALEVSGLTKTFGNRTLFNDASFQILNGSKTALLGENGVGKTTLLKIIMEDTPFVKKAKGLKIGYFSQDLTVLDENQSIYDNVARDSALSQSMIRSILARMLFFGDDVFKKAAVLSGGEKVKAALCKIFCKDVNMLILDEPNNYLDISSMEALDGMIQDYQGTILIVSHDKSLIRLADNLLIIENQKVIRFQGSYDEYRQAPKRTKSNLLMLENRLAELSGRLSSGPKDKEELEKEFMAVSEEIRRLREE